MGLMTTIAEASSLFRARLAEGAPVKCPCCKRIGRIYRRRLNAGMARVLVRFYQLADGWLHVRDIFGGLGQKHRDWPLLRLWGLVEPRTKHTKDEPSRGFWRLTEKGRAFVEGRASVPKFVFVFDGERTGASEDVTDIGGALGKRFDYAELMTRSVAASPPTR